MSVVRIPEGPPLLCLYDDRADFLAHVASQHVDVVEVRQRLTRGAVGRVVSHALLLEQQYGLSVSRRIILTERSDGALAWACEQLGVEVVVVEPPEGSSRAAHEQHDVED